jgi:hypothetical protein
MSLEIPDAEIPDARITILENLFLNTYLINKENSK